MQERYISSGSSRLHIAVWEPSGERKAIMQISHGMIEYIKRYSHFANYLNQAGILVIGNDHKGHGLTAEKDEDLGYFGEEKSAAVIEDLHEVTRYAKKQYGADVPYFLFGHSMGSFMARRYLMTYGEELTGAIICGTGYTPGAVLMAGKLCAGVISKVKGERHRSKFLQKLAFGSYNKRIADKRTANDWLTKIRKWWMPITGINTAHFCLRSMAIRRCLMSLDLSRRRKISRKYRKICQSI